MKNNLFDLLKKYDKLNGNFAKDAKTEKEFFKIYHDRIAKAFENNSKVQLIIAWSFGNFKNSLNFEAFKEWLNSTPEEKLLSYINDMNTVLERMETPGVILDVVFETDDTQIRNIFNLENQLEHLTQEKRIKRGFYNLDFLVVQEKGREFVKQNYQNICPVTGIWIYPQAPKKWKNNIYYYSFKGPEHILGTDNGEQTLEPMNLLELYEVYPGPVDEDIKFFGDNSTENFKKQKIGLELINILFGSDLTVEERLELLEEKFGLIGDEKLKEGVKAMYSLEQAYLEGFEQSVHNAIQKKEAKLEAKLESEFEARFKEKEERLQAKEKQIQTKEKQLQAIEKQLQAIEKQLQAIEKQLKIQYEEQLKEQEKTFSQKISELEKEIAQIKASKKSQD